MAMMVMVMMMMGSGLIISMRQGDRSSKSFAAMFLLLREEPALSQISEQKNGKEGRKKELSSLLSLFPA